VICPECKKNDHKLCPAAKRELPFGTQMSPTGLSAEGNAIQLSGMCACHHREWSAEAIAEYQAREAAKTSA
jgi:hypothetical protein